MSDRPRHGRWMVPAILGALVVLATAAGPPTEVWTRTHHGGVGDDYARGVAIDSVGGVVTAGFVQDTVGWNGYVERRYPNGDLDWVRTMDNGTTVGSPSASGDRYYDVCVDSNDNTIVCGIYSGPFALGKNYHQTYVIRVYDANGDPLVGWTDHYQYAWSTLYAVDVDASDNIYVAGSAFVDWGTNAGRWEILKLSPDLVVQAGYPIVHNHASHSDIQDVAYDIAVAPDGAFVVVGSIGIDPGSGSTTRDFDWHVRSYAADGTPLWNDTWTGAGDLGDYAYGVALDDTGNAYVVGVENVGTDNAANGVFNGLAIKYSPTGTRLWTQVMQGDPADDFVYRGVTVEFDGELSLSGYQRTSDGPWMGRLEGRSHADGSLFGDTAVGGEDTVLLATDSRDLLLAVAGYTDPGADWDYLTVLYDLPNAAPVVDDPPAAGVDLAAVGEDVPFHVAAHDPESGPVAYAWDFGDGTFGTGSDPTHSYAAPGDYHVEVTISDGVRQVVETTDVTVGEPLMDPKLKAKLNFKKAGKDGALFKCAFDAEAGAPIAGAGLEIDIGGVTRAVQLDAKGKYKDANTKVVVKYLKNKGVWKAYVKLKKGKHAADWEDEGLENLTQKKSPVEVKVVLRLDGADLDCAHFVDALYTAKAGKWGKTR